MQKTIKIILTTILISFTSHQILSQNIFEQKEKAEQYLALLNDNNKIMCSVALSKNGETFFEKYLGFADVEKQIQNNRLTKFRIGSISKVFTAVIIFQLIDETKLSLETKLADFFPEIPNAEKITISNLLNHRSGIYNFTNSQEYPLYMTKPKSREELKNIIAGFDPSFEPDSRSEYSNSNYVLLSLIIENITGNNYQTELTSRITKRINLENTDYGGKIITGNNQAKSYAFQNSAWNELPETDMSIPIGAGALISTPSDLNKFFFELFNGNLISENSLQKMTEITERAYGRGIFDASFGNKKGFGHNGGIDGFSSASKYLVDDKIGISITANGRNYDLDEICRVLQKIYFNEPVELPDFETKESSLTEEELKKYVGVFSSGNIPVKTTFFIQSGILYGQATGQGAFPLTPLEKSSFKFEPAGITIVFSDENNFVLNQNGNNYNFSREIVKEGTPLIKLSDEELAEYEGMYSSADLPLKIKIYVENQELYGQATGQSSFPLTPAAINEFKFDPSGLRIVFSKDDNGNQTFILYQGGGVFNYIRE